MDIVIVQFGEQPPKPPRRSRKSMPKSKSGCITCKDRHVKCDERKPDCLRCISMAYICGGYTPPHPSKTAPMDNKSFFRAIPGVQAPGRQLTRLSGSARERRAIEFFCHRTAPQLSGLFSHSFWGHFVLQLSICKPAIRHAMIAVSTIHEATEEIDLITSYSTGSIVIHDDKAGFASVSYSNAIRFLIEEIRNTNEENSLSVPLTACLILICAEFMRGNIVGGTTHIENGVKILQNWRAKRTIGSKKSIEDEYIETQLVPFFAALTVINSISGRSSNWVYSTTDQQIQMRRAFKFHNLVEARTTLFDIFNVALSFIQSVHEARYWTDDIENRKIEQLRVIILVDEWNVAFEDLTNCGNPSWTPMDFGGSDLLRVTHLTTKLWILTALCPNETEWDKHKDDYEKLLEMSERLVKVLIKPEKPNIMFSFEIGCIPSLHFIAWKCRWPLIRRRALVLLDNCKRRECLFDSRFSYSIFSCIMQVEEESLCLLPGQTPGPNNLPPEEARIHQINICPKKLGTNIIPINLLSKPEGIFGEWHIRREYIKVGEPASNIVTSMLS